MKKTNSIINFDLHIHSVYSTYKEEKGYVDDNTEDSIDILLTRLNDNNINLFAITDHNRFNYDLYIKFKDTIATKKYENVKNILPGIEFDVLLEKGKETCHIITIFDDHNQEKIKNIEKVLENNKLLTKPSDYYDKEKFETILKEIGCSVVLIAHQHKSLDNPEGGKRSLSNSVSDVYEFISTGYINALEYTKPSVQGMIINSLHKIDSNIATVTGSDCHKWKYYPKKDENTFNERYVSKIKSLPTFNGLVFAFTSINTRFNRFENKNKKYIEYINCGDNKYPLTNGINAIIGDNGAGKTMLLELINNKKVKQYYTKIINKNKLGITKKNAPTIEYIEQNKIIEDVKKGELFKNSQEKYYEDIKSKEKFGSGIKKYSEDLKKYILKTIDIEKKAQTLNEYSFLPQKISKNRYVPTINKKIDNIVNDYTERNEKVGEIIELLTKEYKENKDFYDNKYKKIEKIIENLKEIYNDINDNMTIINNKNEIINLIVAALEKFNTNLETRRTTQEKEANNHQKDLNDFCNKIIDAIKNNNLKRVKPVFPSAISGISKNTKSGFYFIKKAKYDDKCLIDDYYEKLFTKGYTCDNIFDIKTEEDFIGALNGIKSMDDISNWDKSVLKFIEEYSTEETYIEKKQDGKSIGKTPGEIAIVYYNFKFDNFDDQKDVLLIDQPENDISNNKISQELISYIEKVRDKKQIIIVTHNPLLVVNLDVDNVICINKDSSDNVIMKSGCLEYDEEYSIIDEIATIMDGGKDAIERRFRLYENSRGKSSI